MWIFFTADDDGVCGDEDCEEPGEDGLDGNEDDACDCLSCLCDAEFYDLLARCLEDRVRNGGHTFHEHENADHGESTDDLNEDVNDVAGLSLVGACED